MGYSFCKAIPYDFCDAVHTNILRYILANTNIKVKVDVSSTVFGISMYVSDCAEVILMNDFTCGLIMSGATELVDLWIYSVEKFL